MAKWKIDVIDSLHGTAFPEHRMLAVTYEPVWQGVRLGVSFKTEESVVRTLSITRAYVLAAATDNEYKCRLIRVRNLLSAVKVYNYTISAEKAEYIQKAVVEYNDMVNESDRYVIWDWHEARKQAPQMYRTANSLFEEMYAALRLRATKKGKKAELRYFLAILNEVIDVEDSA